MKEKLEPARVIKTESSGNEVFYSGSELNFSSQPTLMDYAEKLNEFEKEISDFLDNNSTTHNSISETRLIYKIKNILKKYELYVGKY